MTRIRRRPARAAAVAIAATAGLIIPLVDAGPANAGVVTLSPTGSIQVSMRGNGHGHGMSQYGARGAAIAGKSYRQITAFYYPHTTLTKIASKIIRVRLSGFGSTTTVAAYSKLTVTGVKGALPISGVSRYRLIAAGAGLTLQQLKSAKGSTWKTYKTGLANRAQFHRTNYGSMRLFETNGTSIYYFGYLRAIRSGSGVYTVDLVSYDHYTAGVVPREMPASWQSAAVSAQAVAARTYGVYAVEHSSGGDYDICDTTACQVYGGHYRAAKNGSMLWTDDPGAASRTSNRVLKYKGKTIFSQFAASDGGWSVAGGQPYLTAHSDPYDGKSSGDPYLVYTKKVSVASVAKYFGLKSLTKITVSARDRHGAWGGRVTKAYLDGKDSKGKAKRVTTDGFGLQGALGTGTTWLSLSRGK